MTLNSLLLDLLYIIWGIWQQLFPQSTSQDAGGRSVACLGPIEPGLRHNSDPHCTLCGNLHYTLLCPEFPNVNQLRAPWPSPIEPLREHQYGIPYRSYANPSPHLRRTILDYLVFAFCFKHFFYMLRHFIREPFLPCRSDAESQDHRTWVISIYALLFSFPMYLYVVVSVYMCAGTCHRSFCLSMVVCPFFSVISLATGI